MFVETIENAEASVKSSGNTPSLSGSHPVYLPSYVGYIAHTSADTSLQDARVVRHACALIFQRQPHLSEMVASSLTHGLK